jgi:hypothetical protein
MSKETNEPHLSLSATAARNLATATVTVPQYTEITPRWLHKLLPWVDVDGGVYRVNRVAKAAKGKPANEFGEGKVDLLTVDGGEPKLPTTFVDYEEDPREYHLSTIQTVLRTHTRVTDLYSNKIDQLREQIRLTVEAVKEREEWELINIPISVCSRKWTRRKPSRRAKARRRRTISMNCSASSGRSPRFFSRIRKRLLRLAAKPRAAACRRRRCICSARRSSPGAACR